jgi:hypothetical protein
MNSRADHRHVTDPNLAAVERRNSVPKPEKRRPSAHTKPQRHIPGFHPEATPS